MFSFFSASHAAISRTSSVQRLSKVLFYEDDEIQGVQLQYHAICPRFFEL